MAHTNSWDETNPTNSTNAVDIDDHIRKVRLDVRERMGVDHYLASSDTAEDERGIHKKVTIKEAIAAPTPSQNSQSVLYRNSSDYTRELRHAVKDANGNVLQDKLFFVGEIKMWLGMSVSLPVGWLLCNGNTVGSATSGSDLTGTIYQDLFYHIWTHLDAIAAPIYDSGGSPSTKGASAAADWSGNKRLTIPDFRSRMPIGAGQGSGLTSRSLGYRAGAETKDLSHDHEHNHQWYNGITGSGVSDQSFDGNGDPLVLTQEQNSRSPNLTTIYPGESSATQKCLKGDYYTDDDDTSGGSATQDVMNPWFAVNFIIKY